MYTREALMDVHERCYWSLRRVLAHCADLTEEELHRAHEGFGYPSVQLQLHHVIGAQRYWLSVIEGPINAEDDADEFADVAALRAFAAEVHASAVAILEALDEAAIGTPRAMQTWSGDTHELVPAHIMLRTLTHQFQHVGQVTAMCRLMGKPAPPRLDFPLGLTLD